MKRIREQIQTFLAHNLTYSETKEKRSIGPETFLAQNVKQNTLVSKGLEANVRTEFPACRELYCSVSISFMEKALTICSCEQNDGSKWNASAGLMHKSYSLPGCLLYTIIASYISVIRLSGKWKRVPKDDFPVQTD